MTQNELERLLGFVFEQLEYRARTDTRYGKILEAMREHTAA